MKVTMQWQISVSTMFKYTWTGTFAFHPTRKAVKTAIQSDLEEAQAACEETDSADMDELVTRIERLGDAKAIIQHTPPKSFVDRAKVPVYVASIRIGVVRANVSIFQDPMLELPTREWLLQSPGGIASEYGIAMLDKIETLERACRHMLEDMESLGLDTEGYHESMDEAREALK